MQPKLDRNASVESLAAASAPRAWTAPRVDVVRMDAEIGSYQEDRDPTRDPRDPDWDGPSFAQR